jgi:hypothetical protein
MSNEKTIDEIKQVALGDLRNTQFTEVIGKAIEPHSIVIFYALNDLNASGGSGTLVNYKGIKGILTASHVVAYLQGKHVCLPCSLRVGTADIWEITPIPFCRILTIDNLNLYLTPEWKENWSENGLDISLIQLEDRIFDQIVRTSGKQPLDLAEMRAKYLSHDAKYWAPENKHNWTWTIAGTPREDCGLIEKDVNFFPHASMYIGGGKTKLRTETLQNIEFPFRGREVDIIETQLGPTQDKLSKDFSGASGGGVYQNSERQTGDQFKIEEILLVGVFVAGNEEEGRLCSRGHIALYDIFCEFLDKELNIP